MSDERRARVQGHGVSARNAAVSGIEFRPPGTISWAEHVEAWVVYHQRYGNHQTAEIIHDRGGFAYWELTSLLGREPGTWEARA